MSVFFTIQTCVQEGRTTGRQDSRRAGRQDDRTTGRQEGRRAGRLDGWIIFYLPSICRKIQMTLHWSQWWAQWNFEKIDIESWTWNDLCFCKMHILAFTGKSSGARKSFVSIFKLKRISLSKICHNYQISRKPTERELIGFAYRALRSKNSHKIQMFISKNFRIFWHETLQDRLYCNE